MSGTEGAADAIVVCTVGMHRSGTSLVSRMLNLLGMHLGRSERVSGSAEDNPKGFWEHRSFVEIDDEILARFGGRWDELPPFPPAWPRDPRLLDLREKARRLLAEEFAAEPLWGWKDPRTCLTLPFWQDVVGPMRYVMCIRDPRAVVASLTRRNGISSERAERLWLAHLQAGLAHTSGQPRMFVFYEDIIDDWPPELRRMAAFMGDPERAEDPRVQEAVGQFIDKEMCHHRGSPEDLAGDARIAFPTTALYLALRGHARSRNTTVGDAVGLNGAGRSIHRTLDLIAARALEMWDRTAAMAAMAAERDRLARENREQAVVTALGAALQERTAAERDRLARENREQAAATALGAALQERTAAERDRLARENREQAAANTALSAALQEIHASRTWRLVVFSRRVVVHLLPAGTRRRRAFDAVLGRMARRFVSPRAPRDVADLPTA